MPCEKCQKEETRQKLKELIRRFKEEAHNHSVNSILLFNALYEANRLGINQEEIDEMLK